MHLRVERGVACVACLDAFAENIVQLGLKGIDERNGRCAGCHVLLLVFGELDEVEVVSAIFDRLGSLHGAFGDGEECQAGRHGQRLLAASEQHIDAEFIHRNRLGGKGRDAVDDEHHLGEFAQDGRDLGERVAHAAGGFVVDESEGVESAFGEFRANHIRLDGLAPLDLQRGCVFAAALADIKPLVGKGAAHPVEDFLGCEIPYRTFHDSPGRGGGEEDRTLGAKECLQAGLDAAVELFEFRPTVADHRRAHGAEGFFGDFDGTWNEEFDV